MEYFKEVLQYSVSYYWSLGLQTVYEEFLFQWVSCPRRLKFLVNLRVVYAFASS